MSDNPSTKLGVSVWPQLGWPFALLRIAPQTVASASYSWPGGGDSWRAARLAALWGSVALGDILEGNLDRKRNYNQKRPHERKTTTWIQNGILTGETKSRVRAQRDCKPHLNAREAPLRVQSESSTIWRPDCQTRCSNSRLALLWSSLMPAGTTLVTPAVNTPKWQKKLYSFVKL